MHGSHGTEVLHVLYTLLAFLFPPPFPSGKVHLARLQDWDDVVGRLAYLIPDRYRYPNLF